MQGKRITRRNARDGTRDPTRASTRVHFYFSGPNAIAFYVGQHAIPIDELVIYEWDFERFAGGGYRPGLVLPI